MLSEQELKCLDISKDLWNEYNKLEEVHEDDAPEFRHHLHALQNIILSRSATAYLQNLKNESK